jgi:hypothetical protein
MTMEKTSRLRRFIIAGSAICERATRWRPQVAHEAARRGKDRSTHDSPCPQGPMTDLAEANPTTMFGLGVNEMNNPDWGEVPEIADGYQTCNRSSITSV